MSRSHTSVLLVEAVSALMPGQTGIYVDATFGAGGHSESILSQLGETGKLVALDRDLEAVKAGRQNIQDSRFVLQHTAFSNLQTTLTELGIKAVDGILLDLGVSSMQLDTPQRGMSFRFDAPLDMRMDTTSGDTAADFLARADQHNIERVIKDYGEERYAHAIAKALVTARRQCNISTTGQLAQIVEKTVPTREPGKHPATRCFQALRIHVNRELEELSLTLPQCVSCLAPGGRLAVISFHSLEDRIVKRFLRDASQGPKLPGYLPIKAETLPRPLMRLIGKPVFPHSAEIAANPRARSAVMRVAEKL